MASTEPRFHVRTVTAGVDAESLDDLAAVDRGLQLLARAAARLEQEGYALQTRRLALPPLLAGLDPAARWNSLAHVRRLDRLASDHGILLSVGPVCIDDRPDPALPRWIADLNASTSSTHASVAIASAEGGVHREAARIAAESMLAIAAQAAAGNFRFAAAACIAPGTPFFPVAYHHGAASIAVGLQSAGLVAQAFQGASGATEATRALQATLGPPLMAMERTVDTIARQERVLYLGIDTSPAPLLDVSIAGALEAFTGRPFGGPGTLDACALVTAGVRALPVRTCGYSGLMLPVMEDTVLAARAAEGRFGIRDLLLFSSVCGAGLDVVPIPGDTAPDVLARLLLDVASLAVRLQKPLSARLFPMPGLAAGDRAAFDDPALTPAPVFGL